MKNRRNQKKQKSDLIASLDAWAVSLGREARTLKRLLTRNGVKVELRKLYTAREIVGGLIGEEQQEKIRNLKLDADRKAREEKLADGQMCEWAAVEKLFNETIIMPFTQACDQAPDAVSREWLDKVLRPSMVRSLRGLQAR